MLKRVRHVLVAAAIVCMAGAVSAQSLAELKKQAAVGNAGAQFNLGRLYFLGKGVPKDTVEAALWYRKAAEQGEVDAQMDLASAYYGGLGVVKDESEAMRWTRKAAEMGNGRGQAILGIAYSAGQGVPQDYAEAYFWLDLAASGKIEGVETTQEDLVRDRNDVASHLAPAELSRAQERERKWVELHPGPFGSAYKSASQPEVDQETQEAKHTIFCIEAHGCTQQFLNGSVVKIISFSGMEIAVFMNPAFSPYLSATIVVQNDTNGPVDVIPSDFALEVVTPKPKTLHCVAPEKVAMSLNGGRLYAQIMNSALKSNTVAPGRSITGTVFFKREKAKIVHVQIPIAGTVYEFPFTSSDTR